MTHRPDHHDADTLVMLESLEGVERIQAHAGQVVVHAGHVPMGMFLVLSGGLRLGEGSGSELVRAYCSCGPFLLPEMEELELPADRCARAETDADLLFLPRSLLLVDRNVRALLQVMRLPTVSLRSEPLTPGVQP